MTSSISPNYFLDTSPGKRPRDGAPHVRDKAATAQGCRQARRASPQVAGPAARQSTAPRRRACRAGILMAHLRAAEHDDFNSRVSARFATSSRQGFITMLMALALR